MRRVSEDVFDIPTNANIDAGERFLWICGVVAAVMLFSYIVAKLTGDA